MGMKRFKWIVAILIINLIALGTDNVAFSSTEEPLFTFVQISDTHTSSDPNHPNNQNLKLAIQQINELNPAFVIHTGDIVDTDAIYTGDTVDAGANTAQFQTFQQIMEGLNVPYYAIGGNHDSIGPGYNPISDVLGTVANFSFSYENMYFIGLTSSAIWDPDAPTTLLPTVYLEVYGDELKEKLSAALRHQYIALKSMLEEAKNEDKQVVLFTHYLPSSFTYTGDSGRPGVEDYVKFMEEVYNKYINNFYDLLNEYDVDLVALGHTHTYGQEYVEELSSIGITAPGLSSGSLDSGYVVYEVYEDKIIATSKSLNGDSSEPYVIGLNDTKRSPLLRRSEERIALSTRTRASDLAATRTPLNENPEDNINSPEGFRITLPYLGENVRAVSSKPRLKLPEGIKIIPSLSTSTEERLGINPLE